MEQDRTRQEMLRKMACRYILLSATQKQIFVRENQYQTEWNFSNVTLA